MRVFDEHGIDRILTCSDDSDLKCFAVRDGALTQEHCMRGHQSFASACDVSADRSLIVSSGDDQVGW
jgi:WD40 repeat protein